MNRKTSTQGRALLIQIRRAGPLLEGSLTTTKKRCSNPKCHCREKGPIHPVTLLTWKENQKTKSIYIPNDLIDEVRTWLDETRRLKNLIKQMSAAQREFLAELKQNRKNKKS